MKINHINLTVTDVFAAAEFLEKYFGLRNQGGNKGFTVLFDDDGLVLSLMKGSGIYPETFHIMSNGLNIQYPYYMIHKYKIQ